MEVGQVVDGRYEVLEVAGRGGMGLVHRVRHRLWNVDLAVKTPLPHVVAHEDSRRRYVREAETWVELGLHPNIVQCWFVQEIDGLPHLFLDYVAGGSLKDWMAGGRVQPGQWDRILDLMIQACDGLAWAHGRGMVHRDVKPGNLMVAPGGALHVTDFGMAHRVDAGEAAGGGGTPAYGAPEQWLGQEVDARADVYALGVTLFELSSGARPFDDPAEPEPASVILGRHFTLAAPDVREARADVPAPLAELIARCLAKAPAQRPDGARGLRAELARLHEELLDRPARPEPEMAGVRADGLNNRAVSLAELGRVDAALAAWQEALALDAHHPEALFNRLLVEWRAGRTRVGEVLRRLDEARATQRTIGLYAALVRLEALDPAGAERELAGVLDLPEFGPDVTARRVLGHALMGQERFDEAAAAYAAVLERQPDAAGEGVLRLARARTRMLDGRLVFPSGRRMSTVVAGTRAAGIRAVALAGDLAVTGGEDAAVHVWDVRAGRCLTMGAGHDAAVNAVAIAPGARFAVSASDDHTLRLWALPEGRWIRALAGHEDAVVALAITPDASRIVSASRDRTLRVWDVEGGACRHVLRGHPDAIRTVEISPDGRLAMAACDGDGALVLWDLATGAEHRRFEGAGTGGARLVTLPGGAAGLLRFSERGLALHAFPGGALIRRFEGHTGALAALVTTADGRVAVTLAADDTVRAWDVATGACVALLRGHDGARALALSADARAVLVGDPRACALALLELEADLALIRPSLAPNRARSHGETVRLARRFRDFMDRARAARAAGKPGEAAVMLASARAIAGHERHPDALALNAELAAVAGTGVRAAWADRAVRVATGPARIAVGPDGAAVCAGAGGEPVRATPAPVHDGVAPHGFAGAGVSERRAGRSPASISRLAGEGTPPGLDSDLLRAGELSVHDLPAARCLARTRAHGAAVDALALSADGLRAATASAGDPLRVWDLATGTCALELAGHERPADALAFAGGRWLVSAAGSELRAWDLGGRCERILEGLPGRTLAVAPSGAYAVSTAPDGALIAVTLDGRLGARFPGHFKPVDAAVLSADEATMVSGARDRTVRVWDVASGACRAVTPVLPAAVRALALAPGGRTAAAGCEDGTLAFVSLAGAVDLTLSLAPSPPTALAFLNGGQLLAVAAEDGTVQLVGLDWKLDPSAASAPAAQPGPPPPVDLTAPGPAPHRVRLPECVDLSRPPALPVRARIAATAALLTAVLAPLAMPLARGPRVGAALGAMALACAAIAWGWRAGREPARLAAMGAALGAALACALAAASPDAIVAWAPALGVPPCALALAALVHAFRGEWDAASVIPQLAIGGALAYAFTSPPVAAQALLVAAALGFFAVLDGVRAPETARWFAWRALTAGAAPPPGPAV